MFDCLQRINFLKWQECSSTLISDLVEEFFIVFTFLVFLVKFQSHIDNNRGLFTNLIIDQNFEKFMTLEMLQINKQDIKFSSIILYLRDLIPFLASEVCSKSKKHNSVFMCGIILCGSETRTYKEEDVIKL